MNYNVFLKYGTQQLSEGGVPSAYLDCLILLEHVTGKDRSYILAHPETIISTQNKNVLDGYLANRRLHVPVAQIVQHVEFYGRRFFVNDKVLIPRPESETMIDNLKALVSTEFRHSGTKKLTKRPLRILAADVGTGSGALGITAMLKVENLDCHLIDIDPEALKVAKKNVVLHTITTSIIRADLLKGNENNYEILLCNLPYVPDSFHINLAANHEPSRAIFGGPDGLDLYRKLFDNLSITQRKPLYILSEALPTSHNSLMSIAEKHGYGLDKTDDFIQVFKAVAGN